MLRLSHRTSSRAGESASLVGRAAAFRTYPQRSILQTGSPALVVCERLGSTLPKPLLHMESRVLVDPCSLAVHFHSAARPQLEAHRQMVDSAYRRKDQK